MPPVGESGEKTYRIFKKGHTTHEQIATAIAEIASDGNDAQGLVVGKYLRTIPLLTVVGLLVGLVAEGAGGNHVYYQRKLASTKHITAD